MRILLVEDEASTLALLERSLNKWGYDVDTAENGSKAIDVLNRHRVDMIVSDWLMPEMNGLELCQRVRRLDLKHYIYIVLISAQDTRMDIVRGLQEGIDDYLTKPLNLEELKARLEIGARIITLERELNQKFTAIKRNYYQTIHMFTQLLETYSEILGGHCRRVGQFSLALAKRHDGIPPEDYPVVEAAGLLHDIGLVGLPDILLHKRRVEWTGDEGDLYRTHPERGEAVLNQVDLLRPVARIVRSHHEQPNGRGFPDGLAGDQIPLGSRIVAAASIYDDLIRLEKQPLAKIPEHLQQLRGYQLEPALVDLLLEINLAQIESEAKRKDMPIALSQLEEGMILARDVRMKTGAFLMAADTCIQAHAIEKLIHYSELGQINDKVYICK